MTRFRLPRRRAPRWLYELTAWSTAAVLIAGIVGAFAIKPQEILRVEENPPLPAIDLSLEKVVPSPVIGRTQKPAAGPAPAPRSRGGGDVRTRARGHSRSLESAESILGPPPGPQRDAVPARFAAPQDRYAFLVGVTNYRPPTGDTIGSANDVRFISRALVANGWLRQNIRIITDSEVSGGAIRSGLTWLAGKSKPGTFSLFHYSGHVKMRGGGREALWPVDRDFVDDTQVTNLLNRSQGKLWVDIAGCEAGSFMPGLPSSRVLFSGSSRGSEKSYEYPDWGMSVWTGLLFDLGMSQGGADADRNGSVTIGEALRYATYYAQAITLRQRPYGRQTPQVAGDSVRGWTLAAPPA